MQLKELISPDKLVDVVQAKAEELLAAITTIDKRLRKSIEGPSVWPVVKIQYITFM